MIFSVFAGELAPRSSLSSDGLLRHHNLQLESHGQHQQRATSATTTAARGVLQRPLLPQDQQLRQHEEEEEPQRRSQRGHISQTLNHLILLLKKHEKARCFLVFFSE